jgi:hypothetical protein
MTVFLTWAFKATGATTARTLPNRLADVVNVKDYGAPGDGTDQTAALQLAIDAAFGTAGSPHGTSSTLNRVLRIPNGNYVVSSPLVFTDVRGGQIIGDGVYATFINGATSIMTFNGCEDTYIGGFTASAGGRSTTNGRHGISLDAGVGAIGLSNVTLCNVSVGASQYGIRIAPGGVGGNNILLLYVQPSEVEIGVRIEGADCNVCAVAGQVLETTTTGFWVEAGNLSCNMMFARPVTAGGQDILHDSTGITTVYGIRTESKNFITANAGKVISISNVHQGGAGNSIECNSPATVRAIACEFGEVGTPTSGCITGDGDVFLRDVHFANGDPIHLSSFTGRICECATDESFTFAQLPPAAQGLQLNISNSNTSGWGLTVASSGGNAVLGRYNGSVWTVVGK